ncbi:helix-turn-helix domain-containing protein [Alteraurantiacibacter buctensis]|uniref:Helix-turn-helix domain-containing protein n=1 Tax=Alteraurantiacibacter buctensis TaxID=1503981 RepID=A0A844Z216_9SPHN|nr:helix-turn-helix domain-containing protein [Alteraurantiacibacter buctensis]MXO73031.1 helix-turn-helix domain-containing protein [Alteraurantiacibacter buctensis]
MNVASAYDYLLTDLSEVLPALRTRVWENSVHLAFPGVRVAPAEGQSFNGRLKQISIGPVRIGSVCATAHTVEIDNSVIRKEEALFAVLIVKSGTHELSHPKGEIILRPGDMTVLQNNLDFTIKSLEGSEVLICTLPQVLFAEKARHFLELSGRRLPADAPLASLLQHHLEQAFERHRQFSEVDCSAWLAAFLALASGLRRSPADDNEDIPHWRVEAALRMIEERINCFDLTAEAIARSQNISRRRLDQLFTDATGETIASKILELRLMKAASALCDMAQHERHVTSIAFDSGFKDSAHFSRVFRRRFNMSPSQWRKNAISDWAWPEGRSR